MKAEIATATPVNPPKVLILELSETEARALYWAIEPSEAGSCWQEIGATDADEAVELVAEIETAIDDAFGAEGLKLNVSS